MLATMTTDTHDADDRAATPVTGGPAAPDLGAFFSMSPVLACVADDTGHFVHLGGNWTELLGWTDAELRTEPFFSFVHPDDLAATRLELDALAAGRPSVGFRNRYRTADGRWVWLRWHARPVGPSEIFAIAWDVTTEVLQADVLAERTEFLELLTRFQRASYETDDQSVAFAGVVDELRRFADCDDVLIGMTATGADGRPGIEILAASDGFTSMGDASWTAADGSGASGVTCELCAIAQAAYTGRPSVEDAQSPSEAAMCHPTGTRILAVPVGSGDDPVGVVAFRRRSGGSSATTVSEGDARFVELIRPLTAAFATAVVRHRGNLASERITSEFTKLAATFAAAARTTRTGIVLLDRSARIAAVNPAFTELSGLPADGVVGASPVCFLDHREIAAAVDALAGGTPDGGDEAEAAFGIWLCEAGDDTREWSIVRPDGSTTPVQLTVGPIEADGEMDGWVITAFPLEDRVRTEAARTHAALLEQQLESLRDSEERRRLLSEATVYVLASTSVDDALDVVDHYVPAVTGRHGARLLVTPDALDRRVDLVAGDCWALRSGQRHVSHVGQATRCRHLPADGSWACVPVDCSGRHIGVLVVPLPSKERPDVEDEDVGVDVEEILVNSSDAARQFGTVIANVELRLSLEARASTDPLTEVGNRRAGEEALREAMSESRRTSTSFGVLILDIDRFKAVNDTPGYGHEAGDAVLRNVARLLRDTVRSDDTVVRMGGDEFMVVLRNADLATSREFAEHIRGAVAERHVVAPDTACTVSIGGVVGDASDTHRDAVMAAADAALYRSKAAGRNTVTVVRLADGTEGEGERP